MPLDFVVPECLKRSISKKKLDVDPKVLKQKERERIIKI